MTKLEHKDVQLSNPEWVKNPIFGLCGKLCSLNLNIDGELELFKDRKGSIRLYSALRGIKPRILRKVNFLSTEQWKRLEESWCALMFTVTMNRDFDPQIRDYALFWSIRMFKIWYITAAVRRGTCVTRYDKNQKVWIRRLKGFESSHDMLCKTAKTLSSWLQYASLSWEENTQPREMSWFPGWNHQSNRPTMVWMSGHLRHWRDFCQIDKTDHNLACLVQIRTFGRALPIPSKLQCEADLKETLEILTSDHKVDDKVLETVEYFAKKHGEKLQVNSMPVWTHFSVSHSASLISSQSEGGKAADLQLAVDMLLKSDCYPLLTKDIGVFRTDPYDTFETRLDVLMLSRKRPILYDCYGQEVIVPAWYESPYANGLKPPQLFDTNTVSALQYNYEASSITSNIGFRLLDILYRRPDQLIGQNYLRKLVPEDKHSLPDTTGKALLFWSSGRLALSGDYEPKPDWFIMVPNHSSFDPMKNQYKEFIPCPVWLEKQIVRYNPTEYPSVMLTSLAEPGSKVRGLGKGDTAYNIIGQTMRFMADPVFVRDGSARIGLESDNKLWQFLKFLQKVGKDFPPTAILMSSDYRRATDYLALRLIEALWCGFLSGLPKAHPFWVFSKLIWSPRRLFLDQKLIPDRKVYISRCGSFQGEPVSFLTLTLYNLVVLNMTIHYCVSGKPIWSIPDVEPQMGPLPRAVCGDDVAALWPHVRYSTTFRTIVLGTGMFLSKGKDGDSKRVLIFCEDHVIAQYDLETKQWSFSYADTVKCRLLTNMSRQGTSRVASILGKGRMVSTQLEWFPNDTVRQITVKIYYDLVERIYSGWTSRMKLPMTFPASCGGLSLPKIGNLTQDELLYAKYIFWLTEQPRTVKTLIEVMKLRALSERYRYGVPNPEFPDELLSRIGSFKPYNGDIDDEVDAFGIYSEEQVKEIYKLVVGKDMTSPMAEFLPLTYKDICLFARNECGLVPIWDALDQLERHTVFTAMLTSQGKEEPETLTLNKWVKKASNYWRRIEKQYKSEYQNYSLPDSVSLKDVHWRIQNYFSGFVFMRTFTDMFRKFGPSLALGINRYTRPPPTPRVGRTTSFISLLDLRELITLKSAVAYEPIGVDIVSTSD